MSSLLKSTIAIGLGPRGPHQVFERQVRTGWGRKLEAVVQKLGKRKVFRSKD